MTHALIRERFPAPSPAMNSTAVRTIFGMQVMQQMMQDWLPRRAFAGADGFFSVNRKSEPLHFCYIAWPANIEWIADAQSIN